MNDNGNTYLSLYKITKQYGAFTALNDFTYDFTPGVYGLLGPNGAGKSTLMNIITDNLKPTSGTVKFDGMNTSDMDEDFRKILGFMPQQQGLYPNFTLERFLYYMAALKGMKKREAKEDIERLIGLVNLDSARSKRLGGFSGGMKQRALIAQAMLADPKIIILDEPTAGLDPKERIRIRNLIAEIAFEKIVIIATHVVSDIEFIAKEVLLLKQGEIIGAGKPHELCDKISGNVFNITASETQLSEISDKYKVGNISKDEQHIFVRVISDNAPKGYEYEVCKPDLEDLYLYYFD
ncbi:ABC transporter ATP-binding protein [Ruminococcus sp.]|uniref:ABC transporter ATP-binding protein n=1 Tax=Ruminococcus sp. TaxID=41978 RepID=UPI0025F9E012|nr:ABC transporter ATP-binding protein [Ruminococcus sp.]MBQ8966962.1 ABC transporter ATP-binding protein [Ruminococcus sp.]